MMKLKTEFKADLKEAKKYRLSGTGMVFVFFSALITAIIFDNFGRFELARPSMMSMVGLILVVILKRRYIRTFWFWFVIAFFVALHLILILSVTWTTRWVPAAVSGGYVNLDVLAMLVAVLIAERIFDPLMRGKHTLQYMQKHSQAHAEPEKEFNNQAKDSIFKLSE